MPENAAKIDKRERRLLANERSYRGLRRLGFWVGGPWFIASFFYPLLEGLDAFYLSKLPTMLPWWGSLILLAVGFVAHLKVQHLDSIQMHLERRRFGKCPQCGYDLHGKIDAGCPECGWRRAVDA